MEAQRSSAAEDDAQRGPALGVDAEAGEERDRLQGEIERLRESTPRSTTKAALESEVARLRAEAELGRLDQDGRFLADWFKWAELPQRRSRIACCRYRYSTCSPWRRWRVSRT